MADSPTTEAARRTQVLIVEDDKFLQKILLMKFSAEDFDVRAAADGEEAIKQMMLDRPQLVLLDLILPRLNGFEVMTEMKTNPQLAGVPVVVLSNLGQEEDMKRARDLGAIDFLVKSSVSIHEVVQKVKEAYAKFLS